MPVIDELIGSASGTFEVSTDPNGVWIYVDPENAPLPPKGWKLHLSAIPSSAEEVIRRSFPSLASERVPFKLTANERHLHEINQGAGGRRQVGKFITVYPKDDEQAVRLARSLVAATEGLRGPRIPSDRALSPTSVVHYRYGDFVMDESSEGAAVAPDDDPFDDAGLVAPSEQRLIAGRYLITSTLHRSVRGAIHLAVDVPNAETCILKRAWRDASAMPDGTDARDRLREEADLMKGLGPDPHFPEVMDVVEHEADLFMVMEYVRGDTWARWAHDTDRERSFDELAGYGRDLAIALKKIHEHGYAHRDLSPANVILREGGGIALVDFELARRIGERDEGFSAGTPGYMSPGQRRSAPATTLDDTYGFAALVYLAATGRDPGPDASTSVAAGELRASGMAPPASDAIAAALGDQQGEQTPESLAGVLISHPPGRESTGGI